MYVFVVFGFLFLLLSPAVISTELSDIDKCLIELQRNKIPGKNTTKSLAGIVGIGWDDLRNVPTIPVFSTTFKKCLFVPDNDFLMADNTFAIPVKDIALDRTSATFESFDEYMSSSSNKITVSASATIKGFSAGGSFSYENEETKKDFYKSNSFMMSNKILYKAYDLVANAAEGLDEHFVRRLNDIAKAINEGKKNLAIYKSQKIICDYGTHVVFKATVGASVEQQVFIDSSEKFHGEDRMTAIKAEVEAGFQALFSVKTATENKQSSSEKHFTKNSTTRSVVRTKGGPNIERLSGTDPKASAMYIDNLVGLNQEGQFLYEIVEVADIKYPDDIKIQLENYLHDATEEYYRFNTIHGCTNASAESFNFMANKEDGSCIDAEYTFEFGGYFQQCTPVTSYTRTEISIPFGDQCQIYEQTNPITSNFSCPDGFEQKEAYYGLIDFAKREHKKEIEKCHKFLLFFTRCGMENITEIINDRIQIKSFVCLIKQQRKAKTTLAPIIPNMLDEIMDFKTLQAIDNEPQLLEIFLPDYFGDREATMNDTFFARRFKKTRESEYHHLTPLAIREDQIRKLADFPNATRALVPVLNLTNPKTRPGPASVARFYIVPQNGDIINLFFTEPRISPVLYKAIGENPEILIDMIHPKDPAPPPAQTNPSRTLFGGIFSETQINVFTGARSCPLNFKEFSFLLDTKICIWRDTTEPWPITIGGMYNDCDVPASSKMIKECPAGYSSYIAAAIEDCTVTYCIRMANKKIFEAPALNRPPFISRELAMGDLSIG